MRLRVGSRCCGFVGPRDDDDGGFAEPLIARWLALGVVGYGRSAEQRTQRAKLAIRYGIRRRYSPPESYRAGCNILIARGIVRLLPR
jgi:hypothetical protein